MQAQAIESQHRFWRYLLTNSSYKGDPQIRLDHSLKSQYVLTDDVVNEELEELPSQLHHCSNCGNDKHNI